MSNANIARTIARQVRVLGSLKASMDKRIEAQQQLIEVAIGKATAALAQAEADLLGVELVKPKSVKVKPRVASAAAAEEEPVVKKKVPKTLVAANPIPRERERDRKIAPKAEAKGSAPRPVVKAHGIKKALVEAK